MRWTTSWIPFSFTNKYCSFKSITYNYKTNYYGAQKIYKLGLLHSDSAIGRGPLLHIEA